MIGDLVNSMEKAVSDLEIATEAGNFDEVNRLRILILDLYKKIDGALAGNV